MLNSENNNLRQSIFISVMAFLVLAIAVPSHASRIEKEKIRKAIHDKKASWSAEDTSVSDLSKDMRKKRLGLIPDASASASVNLTEPLTSATFATTSLDYRNDNGYSYVTPVKDQGGCGSCWAFATTAALESQVLKTKGTVEDLAEQTLISCGGGGDCNGGMITQAAYYVKITGLPNEYLFPYAAYNAPCSAATVGWQDYVFRISRWSSIRWSVSAIKNALVSSGPLVGTMQVYSDFYFYGGGVYQYVSGDVVGLHAVLIVGYDDSLQAFIVKNSWGTGWGEAGFFKIAYSEVANGALLGKFGTLAYKMR